VKHVEKMPLVGPAPSPTRWFVPFDKIDMDGAATMSASSFEVWVRDRWSRAFTHDLHRDLAIAGLGIGGEAGEVQEHVKKFIRDGKLPGKKLLYELGDVIHYAVVIGAKFGFSLEQILGANVDKLEARDRGERID
jgi:NTP pyrophosphatase (non-canonical NTP hydrolase)